MRLGGFAAITLLVLIVLVEAFPQVVESRSSNIEDHMTFTRELATQAAQLDTLKSQYAAVADLPVRMARIEERLDIMVRMVWALLGGMFALLGKEAWAAMKALRSRRYANGDSGGL